MKIEKGGRRRTGGKKGYAFLKGEDRLELVGDPGADIKEKEKGSPLFCFVYLCLFCMYLAHHEIN